jgi:hypothetical protein
MFLNQHLCHIVWAPGIGQSGTPANWMLERLKKNGALENGDNVSDEELAAAARLRNKYAYRGDPSFVDYKADNRVKWLHENHP